MSDDPYGKLAEAYRVYLNPDLQLIMDGVDLSEHCYYHLKKLPPAASKFWSSIDHEWDEIIEIITNSVNLVDHDKLLHNLQIAQTKNDRSYLGFLSKLKPKKKFTINLARKNAIIDLKFAKKFHLNDDEAKKLTTIHLKLLIHRYIKEHKLQNENYVALDPVLREVLNIADDDCERIHYYDLLKKFNKKYVQRFDDSESTGSNLSV